MEAKYLERFPEKEWEHRKCEYCGSSEIYHKQILFNYNGSGATLVECQKCGLKFWAPCPSWECLISNGFGRTEEDRQQAIDYSKYHFFRPILDRSPDETWVLRMKLYSGFIDKIVKLSGHIPDSIFEIGGACGLFLVCAKTYGSKILDGIDLNPYFVEVANNKYGLTGMKSGVFADYDSKGISYDLVVTLDCMEHTFTPFNDLRKMFSMTKVGGYLLLKTFIEEWDPEHRMLAPIGHQYHFSEKVLKAMITESGYSIESSENTEGAQILIIARREM